MTQGAFNMKKMLFVAVVALAIMVFASSAFAYVAWDSTLAGNATALKTPHKDYRLNTVKCGVCHAAHNADTSGEVLLRSTIANACTYCHIQTATGGKQIYNADSAAYTVANDYAHNALYGYSCSSCHSVHGASTWNFSNTTGGVGWVGDVNAKILRMYTTGSHVAWGGAGDAAAPVGYGRDDATTRDMAVTAFCTQCHYSMFAQNSQTERNFSHSATPEPGYTHPLVRDSSLSVFSPALKAGSTVAFNGQVAFKNSEACRSCHDAGVVDAPVGVVVSSFPHYTPGAAAFLMAATNVDATKVSAGLSTWDGVCLKCHVNGPSAPTQGVGMNF
jgi:predicted CXXCH cytochrome family protein